MDILHSVWNSVSDTISIPVDNTAVSPTNSNTNEAYTAYTKRPPRPHPLAKRHDLYENSDDESIDEFDIGYILAQEKTAEDENISQPEVVVGKPKSGLLQTLLLPIDPNAAVDNHLHKYVWMY
jgi:hypothetical protein